MILRARLDPQGTLHHVIQSPDGFCPETGAGIRGVFGGGILHPLEPQDYSDSPSPQDGVQAL